MDRRFTSPFYFSFFFFFFFFFLLKKKLKIKFFFFFYYKIYNLIYFFFFFFFFFLYNFFFFFFFFFYWVNHFFGDQYSMRLITSNSIDHHPSYNHLLQSCVQYAIVVNFTYNQTLLCRQLHSFQMITISRYQSPNEQQYNIYFYTQNAIVYKLCIILRNITNKISRLSSLLQTINSIPCLISWSSSTRRYQQGCDLNERLSAQFYNTCAHVSKKNCTYTDLPKPQAEVRYHFR
eukprot:TRINITY_DN108_c0_g1_i6.p1 TRINITY_DN108_c0_g1~~TRINITY_DN108_c0_g1_i6.p1  ORF type:complete len:233 (-),score=-26.24 TRINITY_DN108_c0_g1_i6:17-715(-)